MWQLRCLKFGDHFKDMRVIIVIFDIEKRNFMNILLSRARPNRDLVFN